MQTKYQVDASVGPVLKSCAIGVLLLFHSFTAYADQLLAQEKNCMACHAVGRKLVGPSFEAVAQRYAGLRGAQSSIAASMLSGSTGKWGAASMPPQSNLNASDAERLAGWILSFQSAAATH
ncbi:c-type cytochrome [Variovorax sp. Sphag1AA]|uniref:c-type cytochrome n=1 Tax=Variovorax sp. Sphag1AA TaxID=2587027 RepID=UPI0016079EC0|nr:c-type cytochrome [Variovorax sp. Sphag1AA]MBB3182013.1 cytochrome c [Variovorax sp. Sphag1AA]